MADGWIMDEDVAALQYVCLLGRLKMEGSGGGQKVKKIRSNV